MANLHPKNPISIAVSMALLAAAASSARAAEPDAAAQNAQAQNPAQPDASEVDTVTVYGVRQSQIRAIEAKRLAPSIMDSISAESIGALPDVTITDALQRITGVQINRDAGVGTSVDVRGLPQVGTMLNGEVFITPDQIDSQQPDFTTLPGTAGGANAGGNPTESFDQYQAIFHGENAQSAGAYNGFIGAWNGAPIPSRIVQNPDGSVDVNGDGKSNGVFMGSQNIGLYDSTVQRKRQAANASFQADLSHGLTLTSDYFYSHQTQYERS